MSNEQIYLEKEDGKTKRIVIKRIHKKVKIKTISKPKSGAGAGSGSHPLQAGTGSYLRSHGSPSTKPKSFLRDSGASGKDDKRPPRQLGQVGSGRSSRQGKPVYQKGQSQSQGQSLARDTDTKSAPSRRPAGERSFSNKSSPASSSTYFKQSNKKPAKKKEKIYITKKKKSSSEGSFGLASSKRKYRSAKPREGYRFNTGKLADGELTKTRQSRDSEDLSKVPATVEIPEIISIKNLAKKLNLKASYLVKKFFSLGVMDISVNNSIEADSAVLVCAEFNCKAVVVSLAEQTRIEPDKGKEDDYQERMPVVTIMGHVDHGKTTLIDALRKTKIASEESSGITQHMNAYSVEFPAYFPQEDSSSANKKNAKQSLLFVDTPGHSAFFSMRLKGIKITDILVIVVALTEGLKPQTAEVIQLAKNAKLPVLVALTKKDLLKDEERKRQLDSIKQQFFERGLKPKDWDGDVPFIEVSATTGDGLDEFLQGLMLLGKTLQLTANLNIPGYGHVLEAKTITGKGNTALVIVKNGTVKVGDVYLIESCYGKIRALYNDQGKTVKQLMAVSAAEVIGLSDTVSSGQFFQIVSSEKEARSIAEKRKQLETAIRASGIVRINDTNLFSMMKSESVKENRIIIKADTFGVAEALKESLEQLKNDEVRVSVLNYGVGPVTDNDLQLADTSLATIIAFRVKVMPKIQKMATMHSIKIVAFPVIYDIIESVKADLSGLIDDAVDKIPLGELEVLEIFKVSSMGKVAGCTILSGKVTSKANAELSRKGKIIYTGEISTLRRFQEDVSQAHAGQECGLTLSKHQDIQISDKIAVFSIQKTKRIFEMKEASPLKTEQQVSS